VAWHCFTRRLLFSETLRTNIQTNEQEQDPLTSTCLGGRIMLKNLSINILIRKLLARSNSTPKSASSNTSNATRPDHLLLFPVASQSAPDRAQYVFPLSHIKRDDYFESVARLRFRMEDSSAMSAWTDHVTRRTKHAKVLSHPTLPDLRNNHSMEGSQTSPIVFLVTPMCR